MLFRRKRQEARPSTAENKVSPLMAGADYMWLARINNDYWVTSAQCLFLENCRKLDTSTAENMVSHRWEHGIALIRPGPTETVCTWHFQNLQNHNCLYMRQYDIYNNFLFTIIEITHFGIWFWSDKTMLAKVKTELAKVITGLAKVTNCPKTNLANPLLMSLATY